MEDLKKKVWMTTSAIISVSHQNLARELGTTRVVISRILKEFEREKKIKIFRVVFNFFSRY
jgi:CRP/FNR family transcriptional regulator